MTNTLSDTRRPGGQSNSEKKQLFALFGLRPELNKKINCSCFGLRPETEADVFNGLRPAKLKEELALNSFLPLIRELKRIYGPVATRFLDLPDVSSFEFLLSGKSLDHNFCDFYWLISISIILFYVVILLRILVLL